jgi:multiple sugar transport system substrate-binding protein
MKKFAALLLSFILTLAPAMGCSPAAKAPPVVLEFGMFTGSNWDVANANSYVIIDKTIRRFEDSHPNVKIHYESGIPKDEYSEWLARKLLKGEMPDAFMVLAEDFYQLCSIGAIKSLDSLIAADKGFSSGDFFSTAYDSGKYLGTQYALPYEAVPTLMFVNKTLLTQEGIQVPNDNWTQNDLYNICKLITKDTDGNGKIDQFGTYNYNWRDVVNTNNAILFSEDGTQAYLQDQKVIDAVRFTKQINDLNQGLKVAQNDFNDGKVAFMPLQFAEYRTYKTYPYKIKKYTNFKWDCITMPAGKDGDNISEVNTLLMGIGSHTRNEELIWEFLKLLTYDKETQMDIFRYSQGASVLKAVTDSKEAESIIQKDMEEGDKVIDSEMLSEVIEKGAVRPKFNKYAEAIALADNEVDKIIDGNQSMDNTLKILQRTVNMYLKQ